MLGRNLAFAARRVSSGPCRIALVFSEGSLAVGMQRRGEHQTGRGCSSTPRGILCSCRVDVRDPVFPAGSVHFVTIGKTMRQDRRSIDRKLHLRLVRFAAGLLPLFGSLHHLAGALCHCWQQAPGAMRVSLQNLPAASVPRSIRQNSRAARASPMLCGPASRLGLGIPRQSSFTGQLVPGLDALHSHWGWALGRPLQRVTLAHRGPVPLVAAPLKPEAGQRDCESPGIRPLRCCAELVRGGTDADELGLRASGLSALSSSRLLMLAS